MASPKIGDQNIEFGSQKDGLNIHTHTHCLFCLFGTDWRRRKEKKLSPKLMIWEIFLVNHCRTTVFVFHFHFDSKKKSKRRDSKCPPRKAKKKICQTKSLLCCCCCCLDLDFFFVKVTISLIHFQQKIIDVFFSSSIFPNHQSSYFLYCFACHRTNKEAKEKSRESKVTFNNLSFFWSVGRSVSRLNQFDFRNKKFKGLLNNDDSRFLFRVFSIPWWLIFIRLPSMVVGKWFLNLNEMNLKTFETTVVIM